VAEAARAAAFLRDARPDDVAAVFDIYNEQVFNGLATFDTEPRVAGRDDAWLTARDFARHPVIVAEIGGRVVGYASLTAWSDKIGYRRTIEDSVYVDKSARGRGLGRLLLTNAIERAKRIGYRMMIARIAVGIPASRELHVALGFQPIGIQRRCGEKFGRVLDVEFMDLVLGE
jgi:phosphinothricin acetyltransferase